MKRKPDAAWKMLFSTREIVRDLITGFVADSWIRMLDLDTLEKVPTHFVDRRMRQRITDVVWRVRTHEGDWTYLYLLLDTHRFDDAGLRPMRNLLASVMRLELNPDTPTHLEAIADLRRLVSGAPELKRVFSDWLTALLADRPDLAESGAIDLQETEMGIRENIERWQKEAVAKGRVEGRVEGEALLLQRLLAKRFGSLPSAIIDRIASASREQIETWGDRVFDARSIDEVFADSAAQRLDSAQAK